jgi:pyruvate kinase
MKKSKHTKIVATISDKNCSPEFLKSLMDAGMNVVRINTAHQTTESAMQIINNVRTVSDSLAILVDTKGPEIRTKNITEPIKITKGDQIIIRGGDGQSAEGLLVVDYVNFVRDIPVGSSVLIDDGELELTIIARDQDYLTALVGNDGFIKNKKSINVPGISLNLPSLTEKDRQFIRWAAENDLDFIAHSFVRNKEDVMAVQQILDEENSSIKIIAKIEDTDGVTKIDEILDYAYGIMVARGDLGIEIPAEKIPAIQRRLIRKCVERKKPVIIATQMLHTMISNPRQRSVMLPLQSMTALMLLCFRGKQHMDSILLKQFNSCHVSLSKSNRAKTREMTCRYQGWRMKSPPSWRRQPLCLPTN